MKAKSDMTLIDTSSAGIRMKAPRNETGMPRLTQNARRSSRNSASRMKTTTKPDRPFRTINDRRALSNFAWSCQTVIEIPSGNVAWVRSTKSLTSRPMSSALWSPVRKTESRTVGSMSKRANWSVSAKPSTIVATSPRRSRVPSALVTRTMSSYSAPRYACPIVRRRISPLSLRTTPPGRSSDDRLTARATSSKVSPYRRSAASETSTAISYGRALTMSTWEISGMAVRSLRIRSASALSTTSSARPDSAMSTTWLRAVISRTIGVSVSVGKVVIASTRLLTSSTTLRASAPSSSSMSTVPAPSDAVDVSCLMPSTP